MKRLIFFFLLSLSSSFVYSSTYDCKVTRKVGPENNVSDSELNKWKFSIKIHDNKKPELERCSFTPSQNRVTCDRYTVDRVETDKFVGIKKFYYFTGQFDVQLYSDMRFVENNGRGGISYGICEKS